MTITKLEIGLGDIFEPGMGYVALSRATCLDGLRLLSLDLSRIRCHSDVIAFYKSIGEVQPPVPLTPFLSYAA